ncbi:arginine deiminase family protein [Candidatus Bathyarchaeota archaeon]|nr:arginine deiminase family protein [Candidatus Bathyarchaeota archaeon]
MGAGSVRHALVRPVPYSYDRCIRTSREKIDVAIARRQHDEYCRALQRLGLSLIWIRGDNALPDSCFVEDTAVVFGEKAVICNMREKSRANEVTEVAKVMGELKETYRINPPATIDGGDVLVVEDRVFVGISARTNLHAVAQLKKILGNSRMNVVSVKVHRVLHLKSACTYLGNGVVILSKGCFDTSILQGLGKIIVPRGEEYAADCLAVSGTVLIARDHAETRKLVEKEGFRVEELEMSEFRKGDGALTCLSIIL